MQQRSSGNPRRQAGSPQRGWNHPHGGARRHPAGMVCGPAQVKSRRLQTQMGNRIQRAELGAARLSNPRCEKEVPSRAAEPDSGVRRHQPPRGQTRALPWARTSHQSRDSSCSWQRERRLGKRLLTDSTVLSAWPCRGRAVDTAPPPALLRQSQLCPGEPLSQSWERAGPALARPGRREQPVLRGRVWNWPHRRWRRITQPSCSPVAEGLSLLFSSSIP